MNVRAPIVVAAIVAGLTAAPRAQQPAAQSPPIFRGGTDLVEVDVVVRGSNGAFVGDLSVDDFVLEEAGQPQPIQQFYLHLARAQPAASPAATGSVSPVVSSTAPARRVFVVMFDDGHLTPAGFKRTQAAAEQLFSRHFRSGDVGGVLARGRMVNDRLTSDREELLKAVRAAKPSGDANAARIELQRWPRMNESEVFAIDRRNDAVLEEAVRRACNDDPGQCSGRAGPQYAETQITIKANTLSKRIQAETDTTLHTVEGLLGGLTRLDGRKTVLMMSEGFILGDAAGLLRDTVAAAARANARVYTLDARGLDTHGLAEHLRGDTPGRTEALGSLMDAGATEDSINSLAVDSGGFVVRNRNDFDSAVSTIVDDASSYYVLAFRPSSPADGRFHPISVKVRRPDVSVRARRGYVATSLARRSSESLPRSEGGSATPTVPIAEPERPPEPHAIVEPVEATTVTGAVVARTPNASGVRVRPDAQEHAMQLDPLHERDPDASAGWDAYQRGDVEAARARLSIAAARPAPQPWVHYTLGMSTYALGQYREAAAAWERVRGSTPTFEPVYFDLIDAYLQVKEYDRAIRVARAALAQWPGDPEIFEALGVVQTVRGALDDAIKSFRSAIALGPGESTGYFNLAKALEMRYVRSRRYVEQLRTWVSNERDRTEAMENYQRYIDMSGPYADAARAGLTRLSWMPAPK